MANDSAPPLSRTTAVPASGGESGTPRRSGQGPANLLFSRGSHYFCCPVDDVAEVLHGTQVRAAGSLGHGVVGFVVSGGHFITAVDPVGTIGDETTQARGHAIVVTVGQGQVALLADRIVGLRDIDHLAPAAWLSEGRLCRISALVDGLGHAYMLRPQDLALIPAGIRPPPPTAPAVSDQAVADAEQVMFLTFRIADDWYAAAFPDVERILHDQRSWRLPGGRFPLLSLVVAGGSIVPIVALDPHRLQENPFHIVLPSSSGPVALGVDEIDQPRRLRRGLDALGYFGGQGVCELAGSADRPYRVVNGDTLVRPLTQGD
jgi:chemotaxis signal transduction protein